MCEKVNVQGTQTIVDACVQEGVKQLVFTSSAGTVYNGEDLINVDERMPFPTVELDPYNVTKVSQFSSAIGQSRCRSRYRRPSLARRANRASLTLPGKGRDDRSFGQRQQRTQDCRSPSSRNLRVSSTPLSSTAPVARR